MRFLCLHGRGTNSHIFESQLAALRDRISPKHTFDFIDATLDCAPTPGVSDFYAPPYLCWYTRFDPLHIQQAHDHLWSVIDEDGPYDGVIGFSEGAALAASLLLRHEQMQNDPFITGFKEGYRRKTPFRVAIFFNCAIVLSPSEEIGCDISQAVLNQKERLVEFLQCKVDELVPVFGFPSSFANRITIPTLHIIGERDEFFDDSVQLAKLCRSEATQVFVHDGGHALPRVEMVLSQCAEQFEAVVALAAMGI
ncbi:EF-hand calcium-binding domain protein [Xylogone sp. PMI_703]|nr:EF-hand calcium-binding domain protein [Xylogone sp. PMI_703]